MPDETLPASSLDGTPAIEAVADRVAMINNLLAQHAGGIELTDVDDTGRVQVKFTGMCTGCLYRPITMSATIRPALMEVDGVSEVEAPGSRIDEDARVRLEADIGSWWLGMPSLQKSKGDIESD